MVLQQPRVKRSDHFAVGLTYVGKALHREAR
jgi:hypothetical protein